MANKEPQKLTVKQLEGFYKKQRKEVKRYCLSKSVPIGEIEMFVDSDDPGKLTYKYLGRILIQAECRLVPFCRFKRYEPKKNDNEK